MKFPLKMFSDEEYATRKRCREKKFKDITFAHAVDEHSTT